MCLTAVMRVGRIVARYSVLYRWKRTLQLIFGKQWNPQKSYYYRKKLKKKIHSNSWGGCRNRKFSAVQMEKIKELLWAYCKKNPTLQILEYQQEILKKLHLSISASTIRRIFKQWKWTWKNVEYKQINKYNHENIVYYGKYLLWLSEQINWKHIKFLDEAHFVNRGNNGHLLIISNFLRSLPKTGSLSCWASSDFIPNTTI